MLYSITYNKNLGFNNKYEGVYASNYPQYYILTALQNSITGIPFPFQYKSLLFRIIYKSILGANDIAFNFNNISYSNSIVVNAKNKFLKSTTYTDVRDSIRTMFKDNLILEDFNIQDFSNTDNYNGITGNSMIEFRLLSKTKGNINKISSTMSTDFDALVASTDQYNIQTWISDDDGAITFTPPNIITYPTNPLVFLRDEYRIVIGDDISEDVNNFEMGLEISKIDYNGTILNEFNSISKKGFSIADFDISKIVNIDIEKWKPLLTDFNFNNLKYIERYRFQPYLRFIDDSIDSTNTYTNYFLVNNIDQTYYIDTTEPLFKGYTDNNDMSLEFRNEGTYGVNNNVIYDKLLTNQPKYKRLNKSYEILSNQVIDETMLTGQQFKDKAFFKFFYSDNTTEDITLDNLNTFNGLTKRYINQLSFNTTTLKDKITGDFNDVRKIEVRFFNPSYYTNINVSYEVMTYYIDSTIQKCDDLIDEVQDYTTIVFKNEKGSFDIYEFNELSEINSNRKIDTLITPYTYLTREDSEFEKIWNLDFNREYSLSTNILSKEEFDWLRELGTSNQVYILQDSKLYPIILSSFDYRYRKESDLLINITFRYSRYDNVNNN